MSTPNEFGGSVSGQGILVGPNGSQINIFNSRHGTVAEGRLAKTAEDLARNVRRRWQSEEEQRGISDPDPLPVRWTTAPGHPSDRLSGSREVPSEAELHDRLDRLAKVVRRIGARRWTGAGRLVVLGQAGSGKTILAMQLALRLLDIRESADPVPVIFSLGSWDPSAPSLRDWLVSQLERDIPALAEALASGETLACGLVSDGWILPVLDGFDEIACGLRGRALKAVSATQIPLVLTSRPDEYDAATEGRGLSKAVTIQLADLTVAELLEYLPQTTSRLVRRPDGTTVNMWDFILGELTRDPGRPACASLAEVLRTPLMVTLARTAYSETIGPDPEGLLDGRYGSAVELEEHLLASFIPSIYPDEPDDGPAGPRWPWHRHWSADRAECWLGYLAAHMQQHDTRDLAWWELGTSMGRLPRTLWVAFLAALAFGFATAVGNLPVDLVATSRGVAFAIVQGVVVGALHGLVVGSAFGLLCWFAQRGKALKPCSPVRIRIFGGGPRRTQARPADRVKIGTVAGLLVALFIKLIDRYLVTRLGFNDGLGGGLIDSLLGFVPEVGVAMGVVFGVMARIEAPMHIETVVSPVSLLKSNRANAIVYLFVGMLVLSVEFGLVNGVMRGPLTGLEVGLVFGLEVTLGAGAGYGMILTSWGRWVALARLWLPLTGRLPWAVVAFLEDAHRRGALRQAGAVYQFRHARLQDYLAPRLRSEPEV
jgi:hypothetical protein